MTHLCWSQRVGASLPAYWLKEAGKVHLEGIEFTDKSEHGLSAISLISIQSIFLLTAVLAWTPLFPRQPERLLFYHTTAVNQNQRSLITVNLVSSYSADLILRVKGLENNFLGVVHEHTIFCQSSRSQLGYFTWKILCIFHFVRALQSLGKQWEKGGVAHFCAPIRT